jgi:hypothetical protein
LKPDIIRHQNNSGCESEKLELELCIDACVGRVVAQFRISKNNFLGQQHLGSFANLKLNFII